MSISNDDKQTAKHAEPDHDNASPAHPICQGAPDKEKCQAFVERLDEASNNIDRRQ